MVRIVDVEHHVGLHAEDSGLAEDVKSEMILQLEKPPVSLMINRICSGDSHAVCHYDRPVVRE